MTYLVRQLGHLTIETPNLAGTIEEAKTVLGLQLTSQSSRAATLTSNTRRGEITYLASDIAGLYCIGLEAYDRAAVAEAYRRCLNAGLRIVDDRPSAPGAAHGFCFEAPFGHFFEVHTAVPRDQMLTPCDADAVHLRRLDHVNMLVDDPVIMRDVLNDILGMKLSDRSDGDEWQFMRAGDLRHHTIGLIKGEAGLHHFSFETAHVMDLVRHADRLNGMDRSVLWGPGHHGANAKSYFSYHRDNIGCIVELTNQMNRIDDDAVYVPGTWPIDPSPQDYWLNLWGAPPPELFATSSLPVCQRDREQDFALAA